MKKSLFTILIALLCLPGGLDARLGNGTPATKQNQCEISPALAARTIRRLVIHGHYPYLGKKVLRLSTLQPGDAYDPAVLPEAQERLRQFFEREGYFGTTVSITSTPDEGCNAQNLSIRIRKGKLKRIRDINVTGNTAVRSSYIRNRARGFGAYKPAKVKKRLKKVEAKFVKKGFVRAHVRLDHVIEATPKKVDLVIRVEEKKKLILHFEGNSWFSEGTLKTMVTFFRERGYDNFAVTRSTEHLVDFYRLNGFTEAIVSSDIEKSTRQVVVTFHIHEGPKTRLKDIDFEGNKAFSDKKLSKVMRLEKHSITAQGLFRTDPIPGDLERVEAFYHENGFFEARVKGYSIEKNEFGDQAVLRVEVEEGPETLINTLSVAGNMVFSEEEILKKSGLKKNRRYEEKKIARAKEKLTNTYLDLGYAYFTISLERKMGPDGRLELALVLDEGPLVKIGKITVAGNFVTKLQAFNSAIKFNTGDPYVYRKILEAQLNLKRLGIFDYVRLNSVGIENKANPVDIEVNVQESKTITLDIQAGFDSDKLASGQILFTKRNLFGLAKQFQFRGIGGFELDRAEVTFFSPRVHGARLNLVNQYFVQYEDRENFNATSYGGSLGILKQYGPYFNLLAKQQVTRLNILEGSSNQAALGGSLFDSTFSEFTTSATYDTRNNFADPTKGLYALLSSEFDTDLAHPATNFQISRVNFSHYQALNSRLTVINTFRLGKLFRINNAARIPANKLFFMGGNDTVRGFAEDGINPAGGTTSLIYNAELHLKLFAELKVAGFFDAGSLTETFSQITKANMRETAGVGLRYMTPVGPIRADYGFVLDKKAGEAGKHFHFSFGYFF